MQRSSLQTVQMFKALCQTRRFRANQNVWVREVAQNHLRIWFRWRGSGTYVQGVIERTHKAVGPLVDVEVTEEFAQQIRGWE
jgi:hypothetical protein